MPTSAALPWIKPTGCAKAEMVRKNAVSFLVPRIAQSLLGEIRVELRYESPDEILKKVKAAVTRGVRQLYRLEGSSFPPFWWIEPPTADTDSDLPKNQLQAYRLAAAVIASAVIEDLAALREYRTVQDPRRPTLERAVQNAAYAALLEAPGYMPWELSYYIREKMNAWAPHGTDIADQYPAAGVPVVGHSTETWKLEPFRPELMPELVFKEPAPTLHDWILRNFTADELKEMGLTPPAA